MGEVYEARDEVLERDVAVKILPAAASDDSRSLARLRREAQAAAALTHPNCVAVHDFVVADGRAFIIMELVLGRSLSRMLDGGAALPPSRAVRIARDVADALAYAHARGVTHRDVAPGNVIVGPDGRTKVLDFGLARADDWTPAAETSPSPRGTVAYISPEQAEGRHGDARSDVYSLGCVMYEMLTGRPPFDGPSSAAVAAQHVGALPVPPRLLRPEVSPALETVVMTCLMKRPGDRYRSGRELAIALDEIEGERRDAPTLPFRRRARTRTWPLPSVETPTGTIRRPADASSRRLRWTAGVTAGVAAALLAILVLPAVRVLLWPNGTAVADRPRTVVPPSGVIAQGSCDGFLKSRVDVSWKPASSVADGYEVYRSTSPTAGFEFVARVRGREATSFHDIGLGMGERYYYVLRSVAGRRLSPVTDATSAETPFLCLG
jgi:serine/threonine-protein kinase